MEERKESLLVEEDILFYAFRYALGRMSFAPSTVATNISNNLPKLKESTLRRIVEEIKNTDNLGMKMDESIWMHLCEQIEDELKLRLSIAPKYNL